MHFWYYVANKLLTTVSNVFTNLNLNTKRCLAIPLRMFGAFMTSIIYTFATLDP